MVAIDDCRCFLIPSHEYSVKNQIIIIFPVLLVYTLLTTINITIFQTTNLV